MISDLFRWEDIDGPPLACSNISLESFFPQNSENSEISEPFAPKYRTILMTLVCYLVNPLNNAKQKVRVFFDPGSEIQLVKQNTAEYLGLQGPKTTLIVGVSGGRTERKVNQKAVTYCLEKLDGSFRTHPLLGATIPIIAHDLKSIMVDPKQHNHLKNIKTWTEKYPIKHDSEIHVMFGLPDLLFYLKGSPILPSDMDFSKPCAQHTKLGTALVGGNGLSNIALVQVHTLKKVPTQLESTFEISKNPCDGDHNDHHGNEKCEHFCEPNLEKFWSLEHIGILPESSNMTMDEEEAWKSVENSTYFDTKQSRWYCKLPWRSDQKIPYDNLNKSIAVMHRIFKKYSSNNTAMDLMKKSYDAFLEKGFAKIIAEIPAQKSHELRKILKEITPNQNFHVLESHPVFRDSESTPCRICLNAASLGPTNRSLNSYLYPGPCLLPELLHVLIKFRCKRYGFAMDIQKLFLQIKLHQEDRPFMRYCQKIKGSSWQDKASEEKVRIMEFSSVPFGIISSPFLANFVIGKHVERFSDQFPIGAKYMSDIYVDDLISSADDLEEAQKACGEISQMLALGNFPTHKWISNHPSVLKLIPPDKRADVSEDANHYAKVLGVKWSVLKDTLEINMTEKIQELDENEKFTKRKILKDISSVFDPCGWIGPFILIGKLLMQQLWQDKCSWDVEISDNDILEKFKNWRSNLKFLKSFQIPRCIVPERQSVIALAIFCDASSTSYGACAYAITANSPGNSGQGCHSSLIFAKTRVNPTKSPPTIPRAELLALLTGVRIGYYLQKAFSEQNIQIFYFSDSEINLYRLHRPVGHYKVWLAKRLQEIHEKSENSDGIYYCPTDLNPADTASRGQDIEGLKSNRLWLEGPDFIRKRPFAFTSVNPAKPMTDTQCEQLDSLEIKKKVPTFQVAQIAESGLLTTIVTNISSWNKCRRIYAFIRRFIVNCRDHGKIQRSLPTNLIEMQKCTCNKRSVQLFRKKNLTFYNEKLRLQVPRTCSQMTKKRQEIIYGKLVSQLEPLTVEEVMYSEKSFFRMAQRECYNSEVAILKLGKDLVKHHELEKCLPYYDSEDDLIRVNSRLKASDLLSVQGNPILLPKEHVVTDRVVQHYHEQLFHCSIEQTLALARRVVWFLGSKRKCKSVLHGCICKKPQKVTPNIMKHLPKYRMDNLEAFSYIHLDYFGPYKCKVVSKDVTTITSVFGLIYSCAQSRCLQIDLVPDLSTETFLYSIRQLLARRGRCRQIHSDNAKTYKSASKILKRILLNLDWTKIEKVSAEKFEFRWTFSENLAPHENALAEAPIKHVKKGIAAMLGAVKVTTFMELQTICMEVEAILNDRPLATMLDGQDSVQPITPSELANGRRMYLLPMEKQIPENATFSKQWAVRKRALYCFWRRFTRDYLLDQSLTKYWTRKSNLELKEGLRVMLRDKNVAFKQWRNAVITRLLPSDDNVVRRVELRVLNPSGKPSLVTRPIQLLSLYEQDCPNACACSAS